MSASAEHSTSGVVRAMSADAADAVARSLKALADPLRVRMLSAIATDPRGETCVNDLALLAEVSQPTVSHHLKVLKDVGVVRSERRGTFVWYRIAPELRHCVVGMLDSLSPAVLAHAPRPIAALQDAEAPLSALIAELAVRHPLVNGEAVAVIVRESYATLARSAHPREHLLAETERFAEQRLADMTRDRAHSAPQVLFVCVANAGRSQLAAALVNTLSNGRVIARSAGSAPASAIHANVRAELDGIDLASRAAFPKPLTDDAVRAADVVVTMGCGDVCPVIPGIRYEDWPVGDPALASPDGVTAIRADIEHRVRALLASLLDDGEDS